MAAMLACLGLTGDGVDTPIIIVNNATCLTRVCSMKDSRSITDVIDLTGNNPERKHRYAILPRSRVWARD